MSKEAYYFSHDANARQDEKILMLRAEYSWEGYGIYWALVEMMFESSDSTLHHNKTKGIAVSYNIDITVLESVINTCITENLFVSDGVKFWSESLVKRKSKYHEIKKKKSDAGKKGMEKRWANKDSDNGVITDDNSVITKDNKGKESKVKESKLNKKDIYAGKTQFLDTVYLKPKEYELLIADYGKEFVNSTIEDLDEWQTNNPKKQKTDHNKTLRKWMKDKKKTNPIFEKPIEQPRLFDPNSLMED